MEKGKYKKMCVYFFGIVLCIAIIEFLINLAHGGFKRAITAFIGALIFWTLFWLFISAFYGLILLITKSFQKQQASEVDASEKIEATNKEKKKVLCKGCDKILPQP